MNQVAYLPHYIAERAKVLTDVGIDSARAEIEWILCHVLNVDRLNLYLHGETLLNDEAKVKAEEIIQRRKSRYPLQFILEESWFYGRKFFVNPSVMAPTPETEGLCEAALAFIRNHDIKNPRLLDIGCGSGVISVTMAHEAENASVVAVDISEGALDVAKRNAEDLDVKDKINFRHSDFFSAIKSDESFDLILSNPPYICEKDYHTLQREVLEDPKIAMTSGEDGLDAIRVIVRDAPKYLAEGGRIMFEIGMGQSELIAQLTNGDNHYSSLTCLKDLNGLDRIIILACD